MPKPYTKVSNVFFPKSVDASEEAKLLDALPSLLKEARDRRDDYRAALAGRHSSIRAAQWRLFHSHAVKIAAAVKSNARRRPSRRISLVECLDAADKIKWSAPSPEVSRVKAKPKSSSGFRVIWQCGPVNRAAQQVSCWGMEPHLRPRSFQFDLAGVHAAIGEVMDRIGQGQVYGVLSDIGNYFGSFDDELLPSELPLPRQVTTHYLVGRHMSVRVRGKTPHKGDIIKEARRGIMQGAASSAMIATITLSRLDGQMLGSILPVNFADNFATMGTTASKTIHAAQALNAAVAALPGGHFSLRQEPVRHVGDGFVFLGHCIQLVDGQLVVRPTNAHVDEFYRKAREAVAEIEKHLGVFMANPTADNRALVLEALARLWLYIRSWKSAFSKCTQGVRDHVAIVGAAVTKFLIACKADEAELKQYVHRHRAVDWTTYE